MTRYDARTAADPLLSHHRDAVIEDIHFMLDNGAHLDEALRRAGVSLSTWQGWRDRGLV